MDKPGRWFLLVKMQVFTLNFTLPQVFFKHFASKNQRPGFYTSETLVENELRNGTLKIVFTNFVKPNSNYWFYLNLIHELETFCRLKKKIVHHLILHIHNSHVVFIYCIDWYLWFLFLLDIF